MFEFLRDKWCLREYGYTSGFYYVVFLLLAYSLSGCGQLGDSFDIRKDGFLCKYTERGIENGKYVTLSVKRWREKDIGGVLKQFREVDWRDEGEIPQFRVWRSDDFIEIVREYRADPQGKRVFLESAKVRCIYSKYKKGHPDRMLLYTYSPSSVVEAEGILREFLQGEALAYSLGWKREKFAAPALDVGKPPQVVTDIDQ